MVKALVIDSDSIFQNILSKLLGSHGIEVTGRASSLEKIPLLLKATSPDVVLVGLGPDEKGKVEFLSTVKDADPSVKLIVLSIFDSFDYISRGNDRLIDAYIVKGSDAKEIVDTVKRVTRRG